jgi:hypothetical protein
MQKKSLNWLSVLIVSKNYAKNANWISTVKREVVRSKTILKIGQKIKQGLKLENALNVKLW